MQNVLKHLQILLSVIFLTEALHGQSKTSQNPKQTMAILAQPPQTRNFNTDRPNNPRNNDYNLERRGDHYSQSNRPPSPSYKQYKSTQEESSVRNSLNVNEEKMFANNGEEQDQRFVQPRRHRQEINSFYQENGGNNPHQTTNSKSSQPQAHTPVIPPRNNQMNRGEYLPLHEPVQDRQVQRPIRLFPDPYNRALEKHLQGKEERPVYEDYQKAPVNSRKALIHEEASEENSQWHESEATAPSLGRNNRHQEIHSYQPKKQFHIRELHSPQEGHSDNGFSPNTGQPSNSDSKTNYRQNFRPLQGTSRSGSHLDYSDDSVRKHPNADIVQQDKLSFRENFPPSAGNPRTVLRSSELRNDDMHNSFRGHSNTDPSLEDNLHLRQNYPTSEGTSRSVIKSDKLQSDDLPDSYNQHSIGDSSSQNNFNPQMSGRNTSPYTQNSPDFEHSSTNKDYPDERQHNFRSSLPPPLEKPQLKENSKKHASNVDNLSPSQRLPHLDEDIPSNYNFYSNEKAPSSHRSIQNSKHDFENTLSRDKNPNYPERQQQSEGVYSDFSDEYSPMSPQSNKNSGSTFRTSSRNGQGRNQQEPPQSRELHTDYSNGQGKNHQELSQPQEMYTDDYSNGQSRNHQELPQPRKPHTDYSNRQGRNRQELPQPRELHTDYSNRQGRNHQELPEPQELHAGYSDENVPNFHQSSHTNANSQAQLLRDNLPLNYHEPQVHSQGLQQKYSDENSPAFSEASRTSKIPYVRSFTEGRHLGHQESFQYLPEKSEFDDVSLNKKSNPTASRAENLSTNKKGRKVAIGDYSVENHDAQPVEYRSPQKLHDSPSQTRGNKRQGRLESLPNVENPLKEQTGEEYSAPDSRLPVQERKNIHKSRSSRQRTAQRSLSPDQNVPNTPVKRSSEDDRTAKNLTFSATVERDHIVSMGSEQQPDSEPEPEERDDDDDDFGEEQHDGFLDMGAYTDKQGSFGWYADFPVGRGHDKVSYSSS